MCPDAATPTAGAMANPCRHQDRSWHLPVQQCLNSGDGCSHSRKHTEQADASIKQYSNIVTNTLGGTARGPVNSRFRPEVNIPGVYNSGVKICANLV